MNDIREKLEIAIEVELRKQGLSTMAGDISLPSFAIALLSKFEVTEKKPREFWILQDSYFKTEQVYLNIEEAKKEMRAHHGESQHIIYVKEVL